MEESVNSSCEACGAELLPQAQSCAQCDEVPKAAAIQGEASGDQPLADLPAPASLDAEATMAPPDLSDPIEALEAVTHSAQTDTQDQAVFAEPADAPEQVDVLEQLDTTEQVDALEQAGSQEEPDAPELVPCVRCTALLPCYARYCLHCGAAQEITAQRSTEGESADPEVEQQPEMDAEPVLLDAMVQDNSLPEPPPPPAQPIEVTLIQNLRSTQSRVIGQLVSLEADRYWWKKYF